jgi:hypothetical protein
MLAEKIMGARVALNELAGRVDDESLGIVRAVQAELADAGDMARQFEGGGLILGRYEELAEKASPLSLAFGGIGAFLPHGLLEPLKSEDFTDNNGES